VYAVQQHPSAQLAPQQDSTKWRTRNFSFSAKNHFRNFPFFRKLQSYMYSLRIGKKRRSRGSSVLHEEGRFTSANYDLDAIALGCSVTLRVINSRPLPIGCPTIRAASRFVTRASPPLPRSLRRSLAMKPVRAMEVVPDSVESEEVAPLEVDRV
jgi:hypothetical protein